MTETEKNVAQEFPTPDSLLRESMEAFGIDRETAIALAVKGFEATLRIEGAITEQKVDRKLAELLLAESRNRSPWFVSLMQAYYRKKLPAWEKLYDDALERGQDPATKMSVTEAVIMEMAQERVELVKLAKQGKSIEEVTEAAFVFDDSRSDIDNYLLIARQMS